MKVKSILYADESYLEGLDFLSIVKQIGIVSAIITVLPSFRGRAHEQY